MNLNTAMLAVGLIQQLAPSIRPDEAEKVADLVVHQTNNEPWYRSRSTLGALASILSGAAIMLMQAQMLLEGGGFNLEQISIGFAAIGGGITTLWGRWVARKPLF